MKTTWGSYPRAAVESGRLALLTGANGQVGVHIAAHKIYLALALEVNFTTRSVEMGMSFLQDRTKLSRPMIGPALSALEGVGALQVDREGYRNRYTQALHDPLLGFRKVPVEPLRRVLRSMPNRGATILSAWKIYLVLLYLRDSRTGETHVTHETLQRYTKVRPELISAGISQLVEFNLLRHRPTESNRAGHPSFVYRLTGDFGGSPGANAPAATPILAPYKPPF